MEPVAKPANELEGLIRDKLPDAIRRRLIDVIVEHSPTGPLDLFGVAMSATTIRESSLGRCSRFVGTDAAAELTNTAS
jgi:hypothetical protein